MIRKRMKSKRVCCKCFISPVNCDNFIFVEAPRLRPKDFLENEAELSESDWDSEDEDEKGLDRMEKEEGDEEKFDEDELRTDLEKIHM